MSKPNNENKDIYEIFNDINVSMEEFEQIEMDELEKARLKKIVKEKITMEKPKEEKSNEKISLTQNPKKDKKWFKIASIGVAIAIAFGFTPGGREVLAQIADKIFFSPTQGIMNENQWGNTYVLEEPVRIDIDGHSTLIKNIINSGDYISIEMWIDEAIDESKPNFKEEYEELSNKKFKELKEDFKIKTMTKEILSVESVSMASGGYSSVSFKQDKNIVTEFYLYYGEEEIGYFELTPIEYVESYDELGGNTTNNGILIGATSYYLEGERYFRLWSNKDGINLPEYTMDIDHYNDVKAFDDKGNQLKLEGANDGTGKAYKVLEEYEGNIHIRISDIDLRYSLKEGASVSLKLPQKGEIHEINKELNLKGLKDRLKVNSITGNDGSYENGDYIISLDYSGNDDDNRFIYMAMESFRSGGTIGNPENKSSEIYLDKEDLTASEKLRGKLELCLDRILVKQYGNWDFVIE